MKLRSSNNLKMRRDRRGAVVGMLLLAMIGLTGFLGLALGVVRMHETRAQLRCACQAAALAGAAELLGDVPQSNGGSSNAGPAGNVVRARQAARFFASRNRVGGAPIVLDANVSNDPRGDIVAGWINPAGPVDQPIHLPTAEQPMEINTLRVTARLKGNTLDRATLWLGGMLGTKSLDIAAQAQATIDRRIAGFRPEPGVRAPVAPLVADYAAWIAEMTKPAAADVNDLYAVDPLTNLVIAGADGVPEMTLVCGPSTTAAENCAVLQLATEIDTANVWFVRCVDGLSRGDLAAYGGELVVRNGVCPVNTEASPPTELPYALMDVVGQVRAWPLGERTSDGWTVVGFAAARIVAVRPAAGSQNKAWEFVVQPATLVCSQAVASPDINLNPWIAKLELTQ